MPSAENTTSDQQNGTALPKWCDVYAGLSDDEIAELEKVILIRADLTRCAVLEPTAESTSHASPPA